MTATRRRDGGQRQPLPRRLLRAHATACFDSLGRLWRQPLGSLLSVGVIGLTLALPAALHTLVLNLGGATEGWEESLAITVMLDRASDDERAAALAAEIDGRDDVGSVQLIRRDEALAEFRAHSGLGEAIDLLPENPLPAVLVVVPPADATADAVRALRDALTALPEAGQVLLDDAWLNRLHALLDVMHTVVLLFAGALGLAVLIIVGNTIRLDVAARREEVEVLKLIGATERFIRRPFLYSGLWYGLIGGIVALVLVGVALLLVDAPVQQLSASYDADYRLRGLDATASLLVVAGGCALGWLGARLAVLRQLQGIEPS